MFDEYAIMFPFDANEDEKGQPDRLYSAEEFAAYFAQFISNGVYPNPATGLMVRADYGNMIVTVGWGSGYINGYSFITYNDIDIRISEADNAYNRIDSIVLQLDLPNRTIMPVYKMGSPAVSPVPPPLQRDADIWELQLCRIEVEKGTLLIADRHITDTRFDADLCGEVTGLVKTVDTTELYRQYDDYLRHRREQWALEEHGLNEYKQELYNYIDWLRDKHEKDIQVFKDWFDYVKSDISKLQYFNFDNVPALPGTKRNVAFRSDKEIHEKVTCSYNGLDVAYRTTHFISDTLITYQTVLFDNDGITRLSDTMVKITIKEDGDIDYTVSESGYMDNGVWIELVDYDADNPSYLEGSGIKKSVINFGKLGINFISKNEEE